MTSADFYVEFAVSKKEKGERSFREEFERRILQFEAEVKQNNEPSCSKLLPSHKK